ncbi:MAG: ABC transporter permease, partial [Phycisphaerales bacterium]
NDAVSFLQMEFAPGTDGKAVLRKARQAVGAGVLVSVTAVEMKARIREFIGGGLFVLSVVSVGAMLVACLSVANLIVASIHARQFEFGVLRAVGAERWLLARLVFAEAALIGVTACIVGTAMGMQGAWAGQQVHRVTVGLVLQMSWPWSAVLAGWGTVLVITLAAAWPAVQRLLKRHPRELLAAVRG